MADLQASWARAWRGLGAVGAGEATREALALAWSEPQRKYHTLQHLGECLGRFETLAALAAHPAEVEAALWFHDAVYDVHRADNEQRSAVWAERAARGGGADAAVAARLHALVMVTRHTGVPQGEDEALLVDIDLSILGASAERFAEYEAQIRAEYGHVPEALFAERRSAILRAFLGRDRIFRTARLHDELETRARANLAGAIAALGP